MKKILKFYSETCGPCKLMSERISELADIEIQNIDVTDENNKSLLEEWKIRTIPTIIVIDDKDNTCLGEFKGVVSIEDIKNILK